MATTLVTDIICETESCQTLSSQDAPITNNTGADLVQGNVYLIDKILVMAGLNARGRVAADGETFNAWTKIPVAKVIKKTGAVWKRGDKIYYDFATNTYDNIPRLALGGEPTYDHGTDVKVNVSINGAATVIGTVSPSSASAVTAAEMVIGLASVSGLTAALVTDLDGEEIAYAIGAAGGSIQAKVGTNGDWSKVGLQPDYIAPHVGVALGPVASGVLVGYIEFDGTSK